MGFANRVRLLDRRVLDELRDPVFDQRPEFAGQLFLPGAIQWLEASSGR